MKSILLTVFALICTTAVKAQQTSINDTIAHVISPDSIVIYENAQGKHVQVYGSKTHPDYQLHYTIKSANDETTTSEHIGNWDFTLPFQKQSNKKHSSVCVNGFDMIHLGAYIPTYKGAGVPSKIGFDAGFDLMNIEMLSKSRKEHFYVGLGLECFLIFNDKQHYWAKKDGLLTSTAYKDETYKRSSFMGVTYLSIPIHYQHDFSKKFALRFSVIPQIAIESSIRNRYKIGSATYYDVYKKFNPRKFSINYRLSIINPLYGGLYIQYNPYSTFNNAAASQFKSLSVGFTF